MGKRDTPILSHSEQNLFDITHDPKNGPTKKFTFFFQMSAPLPIETQISISVESTTSLSSQELQKHPTQSRKENYEPSSHYSRHI